jgi:hypothetical protein
MVYDNYCHYLDANYMIVYAITIGSLYRCKDSAYVVGQISHYNLQIVWLEEFIFINLQYSVN